MAGEPPSILALARAAAADEGVGLDLRHGDMRYGHAPLSCRVWSSESMAGVVGQLS